MAEIDARIPMAGRGPDIDSPVATANKMVTMRGNVMELQEQQRKLQEDSMDRHVVNAYLKQGGDLYTPPGIEKALTDLRGQVSPDTYNKLTERAFKLRDVDLKYKKQISEIQAQDLETRGKALEQQLMWLSQPLGVYNQTKQTRGEQEALAEFDKARNGVLDAAAQTKDSMGNPLYPPQALDALRRAGPDQLNALLLGTKYQQDIIAARLKEAQITDLTAKAASRPEGDADRPEEYVDARGNRYSRSTVTGATKRLVDGQWTEWKQGLPADVKKITGAGGTANVSPLKRGGAAGTGGGGGRGTGAAAGGKGDVHLTDSAIDQIARAALKDRGALANLGRGTQGAQDLRRINNRMAEVMTEELPKGLNLSDVRAMFASNKKSLDKLIPQYDAVEAFTKNAIEQGKALVTLAEKVDTTGVPVIERWIRAGRRAVLGDPDVTAFEAQMQVFRTEAARIVTNPNLSGVLTVDAQKEMRHIIDNNFSAGQVRAAVELLEQDFGRRRVTLERQIDELKARMVRPWDPVLKEPEAKKEQPKPKPDTSAWKEIAPGVRVRVKPPADAGAP